MIYSTSVGLNLNPFQLDNIGFKTGGFEASSVIRMPSGIFHFCWYGSGTIPVMLRMQDTSKTIPNQRVGTYP
jgi:hypothetical protein